MPTNPIDLMSDGLLAEFVKHKEQMEESGRVKPDDILDAVQRLIFGRTIKACIIYRHTNQAILGRRLGFNSEHLRAMLEGGDGPPEILAKVCTDEVVDLKGWLTNMRDSYDYFIALVDEAIEKGK